MYLKYNIIVLTIFHIRTTGKLQKLVFAIPLLRAHQEIIRFGNLTIINHWSEIYFVRTI